MVRKLTDQGTLYHEPPYTAAEEADLYRRMGCVVAFTRPSPKGPKTEGRPVPKASQRRKDQDAG